MTPFSLEALVAATGAELRGARTAPPIEAVVTDSRQLPPRCLFVALRGDSFDGHAFVAAAAAGGAAAVLVDAAGAASLPPLAASLPVLVVADSLRALGDIAHASRLQHDLPLAAVTGSNGKTTTKELLAAALASRGPVHRTQGNFNNLVGLPRTLLDWPSGTWAGVVEMGMNAPGEIARLTAIAAPQVGLITCVAEAHLGGPGLGSLAAIAAAKAELLAGLSAAASCVVNADDAVLMAAALPAAAGRRLLRFGTGADCDVRLLDAAVAGNGLACRLQIDGAVLPLHLPLLGRHNAFNAAGAIAAAMAMGIAPAAAIAGMADVRVPGARLRLRQLRRPAARLLDDSYNANPGSMRAAFATTCSLAGGGRSLAILGDMLELGPSSSALHRAVGGAAAAAGFDLICAIGDFAADTVAGAAAGGARAQAFVDLDTLVAHLQGNLQVGDTILVKGSRGARLERLLDRLDLLPDGAAAAKDA